MRTTISNKTNSFTLVRDLDRKYIVDVLIKVEHYRNDNEEYVDISYKYGYLEGQLASVENPAHPFFQQPRVEDTSSVIVIYNEVTASMVKYLLMNDSELSQFTGTSTPMQYRKLLIISLHSLWD